MNKNSIFQCVSAKTVTIKWNITWTYAATISTMLPATSTKKLLNNGGLIGGIVGALSGVLITITVAVTTYIRKSKGKCYMLPTLAKQIL